MPERALTIAIGNELRGDDGAGPRVAELLTDSGLDAATCSGEPVSLLELWRGRDQVIVVDAVAGTQPGRIWRWAGPVERLPAVFGQRPSTHILGLADVLMLASALGQLPPSLTVIGIEGDTFELGERLAPPVEWAAELIAAAIAADP